MSLLREGGYSPEPCEPTTRRPRLLFAQPSLQPPGGGNGVAAWILQALRDDYRIDLLTWHPVDLDSVNRYYGTDLDPAQLSFLKPPVISRLVGLAPTPVALLKSGLLQRQVRRVADRYDVLATASNEADFGRPALQYIHYPWNHRPRPAVDLRWYHLPLLLHWYHAAVEWISPFDTDTVSRNLTLVNSDWTGALVRDLYPGIRCRTVHPPVAGRFQALPWAEREDGVVVLGRLSPEKRVEVAIEIVRRVRERGKALRLHVIGSPDDRTTYRNVTALAREHREWLTIHEDLPRAELCALMSRQRYGLHAMEEEHYGTAVAEMVAAGLVPFVPDGGGQREIVADVPEVRWRTADEAVEQICAVIETPDRREAVRERLARRREELGADHFVRRVREELTAFTSARAATASRA